MREILFRGKRVDNGEWVEGYYVCKSKNPTRSSILLFRTFALAPIWMAW